jgi:hypothetical protein
VAGDDDNDEDRRDASALSHAVLLTRRHAFAAAGDAANAMRLKNRRAAY